MSIIEETSVSCIGKYVNVISEFASACKDREQVFYFRGEGGDYGNTSCHPSIYRNGLPKSEHLIYRELIRFNENDFETDKATIDHLCRMQHWLCPTRMLDLSEDAFSSLYFAVEKKKPGEAVIVYLFAIPKKKIKYYDSDTVTILANLAKLPLTHEDGETEYYGNKSKSDLLKNVKELMTRGMSLEEYNKKYFDFLLHHIKEDKPHMQNLIQPADIFSVLCVKTKLNTDRIRLQKGAFLLFGLNVHDVSKAIPLNGSYEKPHFWRDDVSPWVGTPIERILKIRIEGGISKEDLEHLGISMPYIYPDMQKVGEYLTELYSAKST